MPKIKEIIMSTIFPAIKKAGKIEMKEVLSGIKEHNTKEIYQDTLQGLHSNFSLLREGAIKTKSKIDDGIIDLVLESVQECADADGISLS